MTTKRRPGPILALLILLAALLSAPFARAVEAKISYFSGFWDQSAVLILADPQTGDILEVSDAALRFYGRERDEFRSLDVGAITAMPLQEALGKMIAAGRGGDNVITTQTAPGMGGQRYIELSVYHVSHERRPALLLSVRDTTDHVLLARQKNQSLIAGAVMLAFILATLAFLLLHSLKSRARLGALNREIAGANAMLKTFIDAQGDLAYMKDDRLRYVFVNRAMEDFYGKSADEMIGRDDFALFNAEAAAYRRRTDEETLDANTLIYGEIALSGRLFATTKFPVALTGGRMGVGAYLRDITEEKRAAHRREMTGRRHSVLSAASARTFRDAREQIDSLLPEILSLTGSEYGFIHVLGKPGESFTLGMRAEVVREDSEFSHCRAAAFFEGLGFWKSVALDQKPLVVNDFASSPHAAALPEGHPPVARFLAAPVVVDGSTVAVVALANKADVYEENDVYELTLLMAGAWKDLIRREAQKVLAYERSRYLQTLYSIGDGVMVVDGAGNVEILNTVAESLTGFTSAEAAGKSYRDVFRMRHEDAPREGGDPIAEALRTGAICDLGDDALLLSRDGRERCVEDSAAPIRDEAGMIAGAVVVFRDVTEKKAEMRRIEYVSFHDSLTGLYNRRYMQDAMQALDRPENLPLSVLMGDLNGLKLTNDIFGHAAGDIYLQRITDVIRRVSRPRDVAARMGGDEFIMLLPNTDATEAEAVMRAIKREFAREQVRAIKGSISMGFSCKEQAERSLAIVISTAEDAMYNAKSFERDEVYRSTVGELIRSLHARSTREKTHSEVVRDLSGRIGRAMELDEEHLHKLRDAAYLHDIGKIVLDAQLLDVSRPLTDYEWNELRRHPIVGFRILNAFDDTAPFAEPVLAHHERWDGTGYPRGLAGAEIPLLARIISVAEAYDRMTRDAGAKPLRSREEALAELRVNAGAQFDPDVVSALVGMIEREMKQ